MRESEISVCVCDDEETSLAGEMKNDDHLPSKFQHMRIKLHLCCATKASVHLCQRACAYQLKKTFRS